MESTADTKAKEQALGWLYQDELHNLITIDLLEQGREKFLRVGPDSVLAGGFGVIMVHCPSREEWPDLLRKIREELEDPDYWCVKAHEEWYVPDLLELLGIRGPMPFYNAVYPDELPLPENRVPGLTIRPLSMDEFGYVRSHYKNVDDDEYIRERIQSGDMLGAWLDGELAGFIGTHEDGTMGLLEVDPRFRRRGIARALDGALIERLRSRGRRAFGNVDVTNHTAQTAHQRVGVVLSEKPVYWLKLKD